MDYYALSRRHQGAPLGFTSWRTYWIELAVVCTAFAVGMACVAVASLIEWSPV
jgi:hypothetical protein